MLIRLTREKVTQIHNIRNIQRLLLISKIIAGSHGRELCVRVNRLRGKNSTASIFPGAKFKEIKNTDIARYENSVVIAGSNDVANGEG